MRSILACFSCAALAGGCCRHTTARVAEVYINSTPSSRVTTLPDGLDHGDTPASIMLARDSETEQTLCVLVELPGYKTIVRKIDVRNWAMDAEAAKLFSNKVHVTLEPCGVTNPLSDN